MKWTWLAWNVSVLAVAGGLAYAWDTWMPFLLLFFLLDTPND